MAYTESDYRHDRESEDRLHIRSRERFKAFYDRLGRDDVQLKQRAVPQRFAFVQPVGEIIELGCHIGFNLLELARAGHVVTGVEVSETLITEARRRVAALPPEIAARITLVQGFIEDLPEEKKYDTVILTETLEHVMDPAEVVAKAARLTAKGGRVFVSAPTERVGTFSHVRGVAPEDLRAWFLQAGLDEEAVYTAGGNTYGKAIRR